MQNNTFSSCEIITKQSERTQNQKLRVLSKISNSKKLEIMKAQKKIFHNLKSNYKDIDNATLTLSSLILAIDQFIKETKQVNFKAIKLRTRKKRQNLKREKLLQYWSVVKTLKNDENLSFREISEYFSKYHKLQISYSMIYKMWMELEK